MSKDVTELHDFIVTRGDTLTFLFSNTGPTESDLVPDNAYFTVRRTPDSSDVIFQRSLTNGITLFSESYDSETELYTKKYEVRVAPANTENVALGKYIYDLELTFGTDVFTRLKGNYIITWDATR